MSVLDDITTTAGGSYVKWSEPGQTVTGVIDYLGERNVRKFGTTENDTWENGDPKIEVIIAVQTGQLDPSNPDDNGVRRFTVNKWGAQKKSLAEGIDAFKKKHGRAPNVGDKVTATHVSGRGGSTDPRVFVYEFDAGSVLDTVADEPAAAAAPAANPAETAKTLLAAGISIETVAKETGLPAATIAALKNAL